MVFAYKRTTSRESYWSSGGEGTRPTYFMDSVWLTRVQFTTEAKRPPVEEPTGRIPRRVLAWRGSASRRYAGLVFFVTFKPPRSTAERYWNVVEGWLGLLTLDRK